MRKLRTVKEIINCIKAEDPESCVTAYMIRKLIEKNNIRPIIVGNKYFYDYDDIIKKLGLI